MAVRRACARSCLGGWRRVRVRARFFLRAHGCACVARARSSFWLHADRRGGGRAGDGRGARSARARARARRFAAPRDPGDRPADPSSRERRRRAPTTLRIHTHTHAPLAPHPRVTRFGAGPRSRERRRLEGWGGRGSRRVSWRFSRCARNAQGVCCRRRFRLVSSRLGSSRLVAAGDPAAGAQRLLVGDRVVVVPRPDVCLRVEPGQVHPRGASAVRRPSSAARRSLATPYSRPALLSPCRTRRRPAARVGPTHARSRAVPSLASGPPPPAAPWQAAP